MVFFAVHGANAKTLGRVKETMAEDRSGFGLPPLEGDPAAETEAGAAVAGGIRKLMWPVG